MVYVSPDVNDMRVQPRNTYTTVTKVYFQASLSGNVSYIIVASFTTYDITHFSKFFTIKHMQKPDLSIIQNLTIQKLQKQYLQISNYQYCYIFVREASPCDQSLSF